MTTFSVNEAIEYSDGLAGKDVAVRGLFSFTFENVSLSHVPVVDQAPGYCSSIWITVGDGSVGFDEQACEKLHGKVVVVEGTLLKPDATFGGCGHLSLWPAKIIARTLQLSDASLRRFKPQTIQRTVQIICKDKVFDFEFATPTALQGRLLLSETQREWLRVHESCDDENDSPWYLDENGERLPADELFDRSPWALAVGAGGNVKLLNRILNLHTGEASFNLPEQYGGEWFRWVRGRAGDDRLLSDGE